MAKILVDTSVTSIGNSDPAFWARVEVSSSPLSNKLIVYQGKEVDEKNKAHAEEWIYIQAIGRAAKENIVNLYYYNEIQYEEWQGYQSWGGNLTPYYAFQDVNWLSVDSPIDRSKLFQSKDFVKGEEVELFMDFLLAYDSDKLLNLMKKRSNFTAFELNNAQKIDEFKKMCDDKVLGRKRARDIYHLWCAECNDLDFFLTLDRKLINAYNNADKSNKIDLRCRVMLPSQLTDYLKISIDNVSLPEPGQMYLLSGRKYNP